MDIKMTFPLARSGALHPLMPRRPDRTTEQPRSTQLDSGDVIYHTSPLVTSGMTRVISTYRGKLKISLTRDGEPAGGMSFRGPELSVIANACDAALVAADELINIARVEVPSGSCIEVGACQGTVALRWILPDGRRRKYPMRITGSELDALRRALVDLA